MNSAISRLLAGAALLLCGAGAYLAHADEVPSRQVIHVVSLSPDEVRRLGVQIAPALRVKFTPQVRGYGVVMSLTNVAQGDSDIRTAEAAVADSEVALERAQRLYGQAEGIHATSAQSVDTARHQATADKAQLALADRKEVTTFGEKAPWRGPPRDEALLDNLSSGREALVQATFPLGIVFAGPPPLLAITRLDPQPGQKSWTAHSSWDAPADPTIPGRSFFALVDHSELAQGEHVLVFAPVGTAMDGVSIPANAVVLSEDKPWCYVVVSAGRFRRVPVNLGLQLAGGYFVPKGIEPNQPVVIKGAGLLLARELGPATPSED